MRLARFLAPGHSSPAVGIVDDDDNVMEVHGSGGDVGALLLLDKEGLCKVAGTSLRTHKLDDVRLLPPVGPARARYSPSPGTTTPTTPCATSMWTSRSPSSSSSPSPP